MTRFGVMNHLRVLEEAGLVTTHKEGRTKLHYLNPVPIRMIQDRWISRYAELRVGALAGVKARVERGERAMGKPLHIYKSYILGSIEAVWDAITDPDKTEQYFYGTRVESDWSVGAELTYRYPDGTKASTGRILSIDPPKSIEFTFHALWDEELEAEGPARERFALREVNGMVELTIEVHEAGSKTLEDFADGLPYIVAGLKSLVETGQPLPAPS